MNKRKSIRPLNWVKKLMLVSVTSLVVISGFAFAAPAEKQQFHADITGPVEADIVTKNIKNTDRQKRITFQWCTPLCMDFSLDLTFWHMQIYSTGVSGSECFPNEGQGGAIHVLETKSGEAEAVFWFDSVHGNGDVVRYRLTLTNPGGWNGVFPPSSFGLANAATMVATEWRMETEGKGKLRKTSCKGAGTWLIADGPMLMIDRIALD
jgi:hypothetical protein